MTYHAEDMVYPCADGYRICKMDSYFRCYSPSIDGRAYALHDIAARIEELCDAGYRFGVLPAEVFEEWDRAFGSPPARG